MRWIAWNLVGGILWLTGLACAKGMGVIGAVFDGHRAAMGFGLGLAGLLLLMWVNLLDAS